MVIGKAVCEVNASVLRIATTLTDPAIFTEPVPMIERFGSQPGRELLTFECRVTAYRIQDRCAGAAIALR